MLDQTLSEKIITELKKFSSKRYALTNPFGEVLAKTDDFSIAHNPLDIKSRRSIPIAFEASKIGYLFIDEPLAMVHEIASVVRSMAELIIHQTYYANILTGDEKRIDQLVYDFLKAYDVDLKEIKEQLLSFGVDVSKNKLAMVVEIADPNYLFLEAKEIIVGEREAKIARVKRQIKSTLASFYTHHQNNLVAYLGANNFVVIKDMGSNPKQYEEEFQKTLNALFYNLKNEIRAEITLGVGGYKKGFSGLRDSFEEAQAAIRFGKQLWGSGKVYHFDTFGVVAPLFSGVTEKNINFSKEIIRKLTKHPRLLETLNAYFELDISLSKTAKKLHLHRNTLVYRLEKVAEITGFDPRSFNDAFQLELALMLNRYSK
jgi:carbohydrate diacid regulator